MRLRRAALRDRVDARVFKCGAGMTAARDPAVFRPMGQFLSSSVRTCRDSGPAPGRARGVGVTAERKKAGVWSRSSYITARELVTMRLLIGICSRS